MEVKKQQELQNLINIENKKKALNNNTEKKPIKILELWVMAFI